MAVESDSQIKNLQTLITDLTTQGRKEEISESEFSAAFSQAAKTLELDDKTIIRLIGVSRPTIQRWKSGESAPFVLARPAIFDSLRKIAVDKLNTYTPHTPNL
ncbi:MAG TPA: hypothetical protein VIF12_04090 [Micavibrio sp.]|jgi:DNA-binding transcriptional regulator YiaG